MADGLAPSVPVERPTPWRELVVRVPWWARVLVVFLASRIVTTAIVLSYAAIQAKNPWTDAHPTYWAFARIWDGNWYWIVASQGYPTELPLTSDGHVAENAWAFLPVYPVVVRFVMTVTTLPFEAAAVIVSTACAGATAFVFYRILLRVLPANGALFGVLLFCVAPLSPILQVSYAESMFLLLLAGGLLLLMKRYYLALVPVVVLADFTRPGGIAFTLALVIHIVVRFVRRRSEPFPRADAARALVATAVTGVASIAWPLIAGLATGYPAAYTDTELAWRMPYVGYQDLIPFTPWFQGAHWWFAYAGWGGTLGIVLLVVVLVGLVAVFFTPAVRRLDVDLRAWLASYALYVLAVFFPQSSTFRILMPLFPALGALAVPTSKVYRVVVVLLSIAGQVYWMHIAWWYDGYDFTPP